MLKYSIITPVYCYSDWRKRMFERAHRSVLAQSLKNWEHIVVENGSDLLDDNRKYLRYQQPATERLIAYNEGIIMSSGKWICFLDSDDEYVGYYLEAIEAMTRKYPTYKMFNFGSIHIGLDYKARPRDAFKPKEVKEGHEQFGGGQIVNGTFVFHKSVYEELGGFPKTSSPWDFSTMAQEEFPELREYFMVNHENEPEKIVQEMGNPWGNDFYLFYKYTRKYKSKPIDAHLYLVHPSRVEHKL